MGERKRFHAVQALLSSSQNTGVVSKLKPQIQKKTAPYSLVWRKLTPSQPDQYNLGTLFQRRL